MIHIIGLRKGDNPQKLFGIMGESIEQLFLNIDSVVEKIPEEERYNCYYTCFNSKGADDPRGFGFQTVIPIDIDHVPEEQLGVVTEIVSKTINVPINKMIVVYSGHGIQCLIKSPFIISSTDYFSSFRAYYKNMVGHIQTAIRTANLCGDVDANVWSPSRLMRLPKTINSKKRLKGDDLPDVEARLISAVLEETPFDLTNFKPDVENINLINRRTTVEKAGVLQCPFLKWCNENQLEVQEPQWHAMIGVLSWIPEVGRELCHQFSNNHPKYKASETDSYYERALKLTGPRTCNNISQCWEGCTSCSFRIDPKVNTPLVIKTDDYVSTMDSGFHFITEQEGKPDKREPDYEGLVKYFKMKYNYIVEPQSKLVYVWNDKPFNVANRLLEGGYWHSLLDMDVETFALNNFKPFVKDKIRKEFLSLVLLNNQVETNFFENTEGLFNFNNGILDSRTGELFPHSKEYGFTSKLPFDYDESAVCPRFDQFLNEVVSPNSGKVIMEFMAIAAASEPNHMFEKALILSGGGCNGKSVFMNLMRTLLGNGNCTSVKLRDMATPEGRYLLFNKLVNIVSEENKKSLLNNTDTFKALVTGEQVIGKILYKNSFTFTPNTKLVYSFNELPVTDDVSDGFFRRCMIVDFPHSFKGREDVLLGQKLVSEASGIWNRIIEAYKRIKSNDNRFTESVDITREIDDFKESNDSIKGFIDEFLVFTEDDKDEVQCKALYALYSSETRKLNQYPVSFINFSRRIRRYMKPTAYTRKYQLDGTRASIIIGVKLRLGSDF